MAGLLRSSEDEEVGSGDAFEHAEHIPMDSYDNIVENYDLDAVRSLLHGGALGPEAPFVHAAGE
eukprot:15075067-Alexandrium_andersonii.AAC.1